MYWWKIENRWMTSRDNRMSAWKHLFSIVKFLKVMGWENAAYSKVEKVRRKEVNLQLQNYFVFSFFIFFIIFAPALGTIGFLRFYLWRGHTLDISRATIFIRLVLEVGEMVMGFPSSFTFINELVISLKRLNRVLETPELDSVKITNKDSMSSPDIAIEIPSGVFFWRKRVKKDEEGEVIEDAGDEDAADSNDKLLTKPAGESTQGDKTKASFNSINPSNPSLAEPLTEKESTPTELSLLCREATRSKSTTSVCRKGKSPS